MSILKSSGQFVLRNQMQAGVVALLCNVPAIFGVPLIAWLSMMVLGLVTLRRGAAQGFIVLIWSAIPSLVVWLGFGQPDLFIEQALAGGLILWVLSALLRQTEQWSMVIEICVWVGLLIVLGLHAFVGDLYAYWHQYLTTMLEQLQKMQDIKLAVDDQAMYYMTHLATGFAVAGVLINGIFNLLVARAWQAFLFNPGGLKKEFFHIRLGRVLFGATILFAILLVLKVDLVWDFLPIIGLAYFVNGLSLLHWQMAKVKLMWVMIILYYVLLIFWFAVMAIFTIVVGIIDSLIDVRKRLHKG